MHNYAGTTLDVYTYMYIHVIPDTLLPFASWLESVCHPQRQWWSSYPLDPVAYIIHNIYKCIYVHVHTCDIGYDTKRGKSDKQ